MGGFVPGQQIFLHGVVEFVRRADGFARGRKRHFGVLLQLLRARGIVWLDQAGQVHEHPGSKTGRPRIEHFSAKLRGVFLVGREGRIALGFGAPVDRAVRLLHVFPEHGAPQGFVEDVGNPVSFAQDVVFSSNLSGILN